MPSKNFIVPHDFSTVADIALEHAIATAKKVGAEINVIHVVKHDEDIQKATSELNNVLAKFNTSIKLIPTIRVGDIFEDIGDFALEKEAEFIFMGTHGTKGWQHITGSNALRVVNSSSVPFIVVQELSPKETGYRDIVVPMDINKETKQKLAIVAELAKYFDSRIHVVIPKETDEFLKNDMEVNIIFAKRYFEEREIEMTTTLLPSGDFDEEVVEFAASINADLISFMNLNQNHVLGVLTASHEAFLLNNKAKIPTLVMNPIEGLAFLSVELSGGYSQ